MREDAFRGPYTSEADKAARADVEDRAYVGRQLLEHIVEDAEVSKILDSIDFGELQRIFDKHLQRSIPNTESTAHIVSRERFILTNSDGMNALGGDGYMGYIPFHDLTLVNVPYLRQSIEKHGGQLSTLILYLVCHEQVHAVSSHYRRTVKSGESVMQIGLEQKHIQKDATSGTSLYNLFNEGISDRLAREIAQDYFLSVGLNGTDRKDIQDLVEKDYNLMTHLFSANLFITALASKISETTNVDKQKVWESFIHASMLGLNLHDSKVRGAINSTVGVPKFVESLARADTRSAKGVLDGVKKLVSPDEWRDFLLLLSRSSSEWARSASTPKG